MGTLAQETLEPVEVVIQPETEAAFEANPFETESTDRMVPYKGQLYPESELRTLCPHLAGLGEVAFKLVVNAQIKAEENRMEEETDTEDVQELHTIGPETRSKKEAPGSKKPVPQTNDMGGPEVLMQVHEAIRSGGPANYELNIPKPNVPELAVHKAARFTSTESTPVSIQENPNPDVPETVAENAISEMKVATVHEPIIEDTLAETMVAAEPLKVMTAPLDMPEAKPVENLILLPVEDIQEATASVSATVQDSDSYFEPILPAVSETEIEIYEQSTLYAEASAIEPQNQKPERVAEVNTTSFEIFLADQPAPDEPLSLEKIYAEADEQPVELVFVQLAQTLETMPVVECQEIIELIEDARDTIDAYILETPESGAALPLAVKEPVIELLRFLGYTEPEQALDELITMHGIDFLQAALQHLAQSGIANDISEFSQAFTRQRQHVSKTHRSIGQMLLGLLAIKNMAFNRLV